jgi:hypothetical protein
MSKNRIGGCLIAALILISVAEANAEQRYTAGDCKYHHVNGKDWLELGSQYPAHKSLFEARPLCKQVSPVGVTYYPVSGGIRYEGIWNDISVGNKWKVVQSQVWDPDNLPLSGWSCMVMRTEGTSETEKPDLYGVLSSVAPDFDQVRVAVSDVGALRQSGSVLLAMSSSVRDRCCRKKILRGLRAILIQDEHRMRKIDSRIQLARFYCCELLEWR